MKMVVSTSSTTEESWKYFVLSKRLKARSVVVEPVVAELVEASRRPQKKANENGGFDKLNHRRILEVLCPVETVKGALCGR